MIFDCRQFILDYHIQHREHGKNWQRGWIQICCPLCGDTGFHGGMNIDGGYFHCWKCGRSSLTELITKLLSIEFTKAKGIIRRYQTILEGVQIEKEIKAPSSISFPENCSEIALNHREYVESRNFNPDQLVNDWGIKGTGPVGSYKLRVIIPIFFNGAMVSYQGRDITSKSDLRYKACRLDKELVPHKSILYGIDHVSESCIVVEGITDVWRLGFGAVGLFGVEYNTKQLNLLASRVKRAVVLLDQGMSNKAEELSADIGALGVETEILELDEGDPGELSTDEAKYVMKNYL